jgi:hypothetical protein
MQISKSPIISGYDQDITGSTWLLIKELYRKTTTQVKSGGEISKPYVN